MADAGRDRRDGGGHDAGSGSHSHTGTRPRSRLGLGLSGSEDRTIPDRGIPCRWDRRRSSNSWFRRQPGEAEQLAEIGVVLLSTVVLIRVLSDNDHLHTPTRHIAVGWEVLKDLFTVVALVLIPLFVGSTGDTGSGAAPGLL